MQTIRTTLRKIKSKDKIIKEFKRLLIAFRLLGFTISYINGKYEVICGPNL